MKKTIPILLLSVITILTSCSSKVYNNGNNNIIGSWKETSENGFGYLEFSADNIYNSGAYNYEGLYTVNDDVMQLNVTTSIDGTPDMYWFNVDNDKLTLCYKEGDVHSTYERVNNLDEDEKNNISSSGLSGDNSEMTEEIAFKGYDFTEFIESSSEKPIILYYVKVNEFAKDTIVEDFYILKDGKCRKYILSSYTLKKYGRDAITLGDLSKMTDEEILDMLDSVYEQEYDLFYNKLSELLGDNISNGSIEFYIPNYYDIQKFLLTDNSGNFVEQEVLMFPKTGVGDESYVIHDANYIIYKLMHSGRDPRTSEDYNSYSDYYKLSSPESADSIDDLSNVYFNLDLKYVSDAFCITDLRQVSGTVYNSTYTGWILESNSLTNNTGRLFYRDSNTNIISVSMDSLEKGSSDVLTHIDPRDDEIDLIKKTLYKQYYKNFE